MRARFLVALSLAVALASLGSVILLVLDQPVAPQEAQDVPRAESVDVVISSFDDPREVALTPQWQDGTELIAPLSGTITSLTCEVGLTWVSGSSSLEIDGAAVLALALEVPPWRDVSLGDKGKDVDALHRLLAASGYDVPAQGSAVKAATVAAFKDLASHAGVNSPSKQSIPLTTVMWLPQTSVEIGACEVSRGQRVEQGAVIAAQSPQLLSLTASLPASLAQGERVLTLGATQSPIDAMGAVANPTVFAAEVLSRDPETLVGTVRLAQAIEVAGIPPAAVSTQDGISGCVSAQGEATSVRIVGSQLGATFVAFDGAPPPKVAADAQGLSCPSP